jgi:hypothetical protein
MNPGQKKLLKAIIIYTLVWNTSYFWEYLPALFDMGIFLLLLLTIATLLPIAAYQVYKYLTEEHKVKFRLVNAGLIALLAVLTFYKPLGLIDFKKFEGEDILFAVAKTVANGTISIRLKEGNRFKKTINSFGVDNYWGSYEMINDTLKLHYDINTDSGKENDFATLEIPSDTSGGNLGYVYYHTEGVSKRGVSMKIYKLNIDKIK